MKRKLATIARTKTGKPNIKVTFSFDWDLVNKVKTLPNHRYNGTDPKDKHWICTLCVEAVKSLQGWGFELSEELHDFMLSKRLNVQSLDSIEVPGFKKDLLPFQKKGVAFIEARGGRALVGDEMRLGKTLEALAWLQLHPEKRPAIVIPPATVKINWEREAVACLPNPKTQILRGKTPYEITGEIVIINYDILAEWIDILLQLKAQVMIPDEGQYFKNNSAKRTRAIKRLGKHIPHIIVLSGTPIKSKPMELHNAIRLIDPTIVGSRWDYGFKYCGARHNGFGWDFTGATNTEELHTLLTNTIMIRRRREDVLSELPPKTRSVIPLEIDNDDEYTEAQDNFIGWLAKTKGEEAAQRASNAQTFVQIEALKQIAVKGKMAQAVVWIKDFLSETDEKLVIFATHKVTISQLMEIFTDAVKVDGSVSTANRQIAVDRFQNDGSVRLFIGNMQAAGVGISLAAASTAVILELGWTPSDHDQAEDRIVDINKPTPINIYYLIAVGTIEEKIARLLDYKRKIVNKVLDGVGVEDESLLGQLLKEYKNE